MAYRESTEALREKLAAEEEKQRSARAEVRRLKQELRKRQPRGALRHPLTWALGALVSAACLGFVVIAFVPYGPRPSHSTRADADAIRGAAGLYLADQGLGAECPGLNELVEEGYLRASSHLLDGWSRPFVLSCDHDHPVVTSAGPDGIFCNEDDLSSEPGSLPRCPEGRLRFLQR